MSADHIILASSYHPYVTCPAQLYTGIHYPMEVLPPWVFPAIVYVYVCFSVIVYFSLSLVYNFVLAKFINKINK